MLNAKGYDGEAGSLVKSKPAVPAVVIGKPTKQKAKPKAHMSVVEICQALVADQSARKFCIKTQSRLNRAIESYLANLAGFETDLDPDDRKGLFKFAATIKTQIEKKYLTDIKDPDGGGVWENGVLDESFDRVAPMIVDSMKSRRIWDERRDEIEKNMEALAKSLPIYKDFVANVKGFGALGLAVVLGEACNYDKNTKRWRTLSDYSNPAKLWKRLGLGLVPSADGGWIRQQKRTNVDEAMEHGYNPQRRAEMWTLFSDSMFRHQWNGAKCAVCGKSPAAEDAKPTSIQCRCEEPDIIAAHPAGQFGAEYARKKAEYLVRPDLVEKHAEMAAKSPKKVNTLKSHAHNMATRYMTKCLLRELWQAWRAGDHLGVSGLPTPLQIEYAEPAE